MRADWLPINLSGRCWRFQRAACGHPRAQMRGSAPDNALFQGKLASGWLINRRDNREAARIPLPGRMESVPVSALAGSCRTCRAPLANDYSASLDAGLSATAWVAVAVFLCSKRHPHGADEPLFDGDEVPIGETRFPRNC